RPVQRPRIPIWVGGSWPNRAPFRRAARWDAVFPIFRDVPQGQNPSPELLAEAVQFVRAEREAGPRTRSRWPRGEKSACGSTWRWRA
ncbi:MAG: hypothetical protein ACTHMW_05860, partial [Actinomycetes bacterium]